MFRAMSAGNYQNIPLPCWLSRVISEVGVLGFVHCIYADTVIAIAGAPTPTSILWFSGMTLYAYVECDIYICLLTLKVSHDH